MDYPESTNEDELIAMIQGGSDEAFTIVYKHYEGKLMGFLKYKLRNSEIAEEIFQITWTKVLDHINKYRMTDTFSAWLFTIANNSTKDWFKKSSNQNRLIESMAQLSLESQQNVDSPPMDLSFLDEQAKVVIDLQYVQGLSSKEISAHLQLSEPNVRKISSRAKKKIKTHLSNGGTLT